MSITLSYPVIQRDKTILITYECAAASTSVFCGSHDGIHIYSVIKASFSIFSALWTRDIHSVFCDGVPGFFFRRCIIYLFLKIFCKLHKYTSSKNYPFIYYTMNRHVMASGYMGISRTCLINQLKTLTNVCKKARQQKDHLPEISFRKVVPWGSVCRTLPASRLPAGC